MNPEICSVMNANADRWLLPSRQTEIPGHDLVAATKLHGRREGTFLVLASLFVLATIALPLWFTSQWVVDLGDLPLDLSALRLSSTELTLGVLVFPLALVVGQLVCELFGTRRAGMLVLIGAVTSLLVIAGEYFTIPDYPLYLALPLVVCTTVAAGLNLLVFSGARRALVGRALWSRSLLATPIALVLGWAAFVAVGYALGIELQAGIGAAAAPCVYACACAVVGIIPLVIARRALGTFLRIGGSEAPPVDHSLVAPRRLPPALIIDESAAPVRPHRPALPFTTAEVPVPFTTGEVRFFNEGEALAYLEQQKLDRLRDTLV
jgi:uncharacterized PurR-regulated membrane protein YhhQ (DUF165 family)